MDNPITDPIRDMLERRPTSTASLTKRLGIIIPVGVFPHDYVDARQDVAAFQGDMCKGPRVKVSTRYYSEVMGEFDCYAYEFNADNHQLGLECWRLVEGASRKTDNGDERDRDMGPEYWLDYVSGNEKLVDGTHEVFVNLKDLEKVLLATATKLTDLLGVDQKTYLVVQTETTIWKWRVRAVSKEEAEKLVEEGSDVELIGREGGGTKTEATEEKL